MSIHSPLIDTLQKLDSRSISFVALRDFDLAFSGQSKISFPLIVSRTGFSIAKDLMTKEMGYALTVEPLHCLDGAPPPVHLSHPHLSTVITMMDGLYYRSLSDREMLVPLADDIQFSLLGQRRKAEGPWLYEPSYEHQVLDLCCVGIFDLGAFEKNTIEKLHVLLPKCKLEVLRPLLEQGFYKFTPFLIDLMKNDQWQEVPQSYKKFCEY